MKQVIRLGGLFFPAELIFGIGALARRQQVLNNLIHESCIDRIYRFLCFRRFFPLE
jgi:hypothetical protein